MTTICGCQNVTGEPSPCHVFLGTVFGAYSGYVGATINADCEGAINTIGVSLGFTNISTIMEGIHTIIELTINRSIEKE